MDDLNSPTAPAAGYVRHDVSQDKSMRRHTPFHAFLPPSLTTERAKRLKICTNVLVTRIELAQGGSDGVRATGVHFEAIDYRKAGRHFFAKARREVVVCAGAIGSPQILQLRYDADILCTLTSSHAGYLPAVGLGQKIFL